jgi:hypothetical protein
MPSLSLPNLIHEQHCYHHADREAVVRCPACRRFYCRECVTEHDDRMLCSSCLAQLAAAASAKGRGRFRRLVVPLQGILGFMLLWYAFFLMGQVLLAIPHSFHEGTIWLTDWWKTP